MDYSKHSNQKKQKNHNSPNKKIKTKISVIIFRVVFFSFLILMFAGAGSVLGAFMGIINTTPPVDKNMIMPEGYTTIIYDLNGNKITQLESDIDRIHVELDQIPKSLQHAVVATEDERFYEHFGIDIKGIFRAFFINIKNRSFSEGASTITQQLIKNNLLTSEKKLNRKIKEQYMAIQIEKELTKEYGKKRAKDLILENYLNTINLGHGSYGVQAAAQRYFNKNVSELDIAESAVIAGITQRPSYYDPISHPENNKAKQKIILQKMLEQNYITKTEYDQALKEDVYSKIQKVSQKFTGESHNSYFVDTVIEHVAKDLAAKKGYTESQAYDLIYRGGLSIYITQDMKMQKIVDNAFLNKDLFPKDIFELVVNYAVTVEHKDKSRKNYSFSKKSFKSKEATDKYIKKFKSSILKSGDKIIAEKPVYIPQPQVAMVITDYHNGYVKAIAGGRGEKTGNRTLNRAIESKRQPGSTFKVLAAYAPALDTAGYTPATIIDDVPFKINIPGQKPYEPHNWYDNSRHKFGYRGLSTVREGIRDSMNILAVKTLYDIGIPTAFDYLLNFGFTTLAENEHRGNKVYTDKNYALALGGLTDGVTTLELTSAYGTIANKGVYVEPIFYTRVLDHDGNILLEKKPKTHTVLKETTAFLLTDMMKDVITSGTGTKARFKNIKMPAAGKTGSTTNDKDWVFVGYTPYYVAGVWTGYDQPKTLKTRYAGYHNNLWRVIMEEIHKNLPYKDFERPNGIVRRKICMESGKLAVEGLCDHDPRGDRTRWEYFVKGTEPTDPCDVHVKEKICTESGLFANKYCPEETVEEKVFIKRPESMTLPYEDLDKKTLNRIEDYQYEIPPSMEGEYCNIHGPKNTQNPENPFKHFEFPPNAPLKPPATDDKKSLDDFLNFGH